MEDYIPEKNLGKSVLPPLTIEKMEKILFQMKNSICKIIKSYTEDATGFFCKIPYKDKLLPVLITNNHVLNEEDISNNKELKFTINNDEKEYSFFIDNSRIKFTDSKLDVTFIEIKPRIDRINQFLDINPNLENYRKKSICILHYPDGTANVSYGLTNGNNDFDLMHLCNTEYGSSGSPILLLDSLRVIAIHKGTPKRPDAKYNLGILIKNAIESFNNTNNNSIVNNKEVKIGRYIRNRSGLNNINNNKKYIPESNNHNSNKSYDMEINYDKNQMYMNNMSNNKINLSEINNINNNNMLNNMNIIDNNNFYRINQMYYTNNQTNNFFRMNQNENFTLTRLNIEFKLCCKDDSLATIISNFRLVNGSLYEWKADMIGPKESPYEGGLFTIQIIFPKDYATHGPEFKILNKIYHLNVDPNKGHNFGHISMSRLNQWKSTGRVSDIPGYNVKQALFDIFYLIGKCGDTPSPYDEEMAKQLVENPEKFHKIAKEWTKKYASL